MPRADRRFSLACLLLAASLALSACGFQPRGHVGATGGIPAPVFVAGIGQFSDLHREIEAQLAQADVATVRQKAAGTTVLRILEYDSDARLLTVDSFNKTVERELVESARFELRDGGDEVVVPAQWVRVLRIQFRPREEILASRREEDLLRDDMRRELVQRMLQRVSAQR